MVEFQEILFKEILRFTQYPGAPFTGDPTYDLVSFFFIPMVFIIFFTYMLLGRIVSSAVAWLRMLLGAALFLYMIVNGWFAIFALMSGPYFIFLIVVLGGFYFIPSHFRRGGGGGGAPAGAEGGRSYASRFSNNAIIRKREIDAEVKKLEQELGRAYGSPGGDKAAGILTEEIRALKRERDAIEREIHVWRL